MSELNAEEFVTELTACGFGLGSGVPCSWLSNFTNALLNQPDFRYVMAAQEGDAVAIAAGAELAGGRALVTLQGSGLTNAGSPLTSFQYPFRRGILLFVSWRGEPGVPDEPQHELMGEITLEQLRLWRIPHEILSTDATVVREQLGRAVTALDRGTSFALVVKRGTFADVGLMPTPEAPRRSVSEVQCSGNVDALPTRREALAALVPCRERGSILLATTGYTGRELFELGDAANQLYMVGSMGCVSSLALGLALAQPRQRVIAIDGDGALLMRLGSLATNAWQAPQNMLHVLLDNGCHESTGGQPTASSVLDFPALAAAAGYPHVIYAADLTEFDQALEHWHRQQQLTFLYMRTRAVPLGNLARPAVKPAEVAQRLRQYILATEKVRT